MRNHRRPAIELDQPEAPGKALAEEQIVAVMQDRPGEKLTTVRLTFPDDLYRQAFLARFARRILHGAAIAALLQLEAAHRRRRGEAERDAAARRRRQRRQPGAQDRVLTRWPFQGSPLRSRDHGHS